MAGFVDRLPSSWELGIHVYRCDPAGPRDDLPGVDRLLALSDGVVAIAMTLLVLQLNVPDVTKLTDPASASELATQLGKALTR
jgi:hypothetical protein